MAKRKDGINKSEEIRLLLKAHPEMKAKEVVAALADKGIKATEGLVEEASEMIHEDAEDTVRDAGLIGAGQRVEHYEMAGYGTARALALCLGHDEAAELLGETLEEERAADEKLTELAESAINAEAAEAPQAGD